VELCGERGARWFGMFLPQRLVLGDPGTRDAALHCAQVCIPQASILPLKVASIHLSQGKRAQYVAARQCQANKGMFSFEIGVMAAKGAPLEEWQGVQFKTMKTRQPNSSWDALLFGAYFQRWVADRFQATNLRVALEHACGNSQKQRRELAFLRLLGEPSKVWNRTDGKPVTIDHHVSASHCENLSACATHSAPVACDLEAVQARTQSQWFHLLGPNGFSLSQLVSREHSMSLDEACTVVWCAKECLKKSGHGDDAPLILKKSDQSAYVLMASGQFQSAALVFSPARFDTPFVINILISSIQNRWNGFSDAVIRPEMTADSQTSQEI